MSPQPTTKKWPQKIFWGFWAAYIFLTITGNIVLPIVAYETHEGGLAPLAVLMTWGTFGAIPSPFLAIIGHLTGRLLKNHLTPKQRLSLYTIPVILPGIYATLFAVALITDLIFPNNIAPIKPPPGCMR